MQRKLNLKWKQRACKSKNIKTQNRPRPKLSRPGKLRPKTKPIIDQTKSRPKPKSDPH